MKRKVNPAVSGGKRESGYFNVCHFLFQVLNNLNLNQANWKVYFPWAVLELSTRMWSPWLWVSNWNCLILSIRRKKKRPNYKKLIMCLSILLTSAWFPLDPLPQPPSEVAGVSLFGDVLQEKFDRAVHHLQELPSSLFTAAPGLGPGFRFLL